MSQQEYKPSVIYNTEEFVDFLNSKHIPIVKKAELVNEDKINVEIKRLTSNTVEKELKQEIVNKFENMSLPVLRHITITAENNINNNFKYTLQIEN